MHVHPSMSLPGSGQKSAAVMAAWALLIFFVPFQLHYNYIVNSFYHFGAPYFDAGLFAQLLWRNDVQLMNPMPRGDFSYFGVHFSPFLALISQLSHFIPTHAVEFYAAFIASLYASLGLALFYAFMRFLRPAHGGITALAAAVSIAFAFNGNMMVGLWMPHFEYAIPLGIFLFLFYWRCGKRGLSLAFFIFTLSLREDAGLHLISVLGLLAAIEALESRSWRKAWKEATWMAAAMLYSAAAFTAMYFIRQSYGLHEGVFDVIYSGSPPFSHLSWALFVQRAQEVLQLHAYLWLGFVLSAGWSLYRRNPYLIVGFAAAIPWLLINMLATNGNTGILYAYYGFPFVLGLGWPIFAMLWRYGISMPLSAAREALLLQLALTCVSLTAWNAYDRQLEFGPLHGARWGAYRLQPSVERREAIRSLVHTLNADPAALGAVAVDQSFASLSMGPRDGRKLTFGDTGRPVNSIFYVAPGDPSYAVIVWARGHRLLYRYCVAATSVCLLTDRAPLQLGAFSSLLMERPLPALVQ